MNDPTLRMPMSLLQHHCSAQAGEVQKCKARGAECHKEQADFEDCALPVMYQYVAVKRHCAEKEEAFVICKAATPNNPRCDEHMWALTHCVETVANPRAAHCMDNGLKINEV